MLGRIVTQFIARSIRVSHPKNQGQGHLEGHLVWSQEYRVGAEPTSLTRFGANVAIYIYKCPRCKEIKEKIVKSFDAIVFCECEQDYLTVDGQVKQLHPEMVRILSVPSPPQWNCRRPS
jgi:hypothetical protein